MTLEEALVQAADRIARAWEYKTTLNAISISAFLALLFGGVGVIALGCKKGWWS